MSIIYKSITCLALLGLTYQAYAQQNAADTVVNQIAITNTVARFNNAVNIQAGIYSGQEYLFYERQRNDNVFFGNQASWENSTVNYNGAEYSNVQLMYDLLRDQVIILHYYKTQNIILADYKISSFTLLGHTFVYHASDSLGTDGLKSGIYDQLYNGKTEVLVRRSKSRLKTAEQIYTYTSSNKLYVKKGLVYIEVSGKGKLLSILKDKRKELRKYISDNNIDFSRNQKEAGVTTVVKYYDKLTQQ